MSRLTPFVVLWMAVGSGCEAIKAEEEVGPETKHLKLM